MNALGLMYFALGCLSVLPMGVLYWVILDRVIK